MRSIAIAALAVLAACQREEPKAPPAASAPAAPASTQPAETPKAIIAEGWRTDVAAYPLLGQTIPKFTAKLNAGGEVTQEALRNHWTILAFWGLWSDDSLADARYMRALVSAVDQDPDLEFLSIHIPPALGKGDVAFGAFRSLDQWFKDQGGTWPTAIDTDGSISDRFQITGAPIYLLVGPDLTIEGWRTDLSSTPDNGIKSVVRGVAAIKKQIAAPE
jgi:hypothetical protein